ncbi:hypothetical protein ACIBH1_39925 [Nonomuraea sp. NPDC050663]|uniref:hypothetical protein n=1 Tax=Nonomuraea sp. NPDC050663 TaxID=3364370 RepID=UPI0037A22813
MTVLERRYRWLLRCYPRAYRTAHGGELLDLLLDSARPGRRVPEAREVVGLVSGGLQARVHELARGNPWWDGMHLGVTAIMAANTAALLPYFGSLPIWVVMSLAALLAILRGRTLLALPLVVATGAKATTIAAGGQLFELTLIPVYPDLLTDRALYSTTSPFAVAAGYILVAASLLVLRGVRQPRSVWWLAALPLVAWSGPEWISEGGESFPLSLNRLVLEAALIALGAWAGHVSRDPRWALGSALYLLVFSTEMAQHLDFLSRQHLAYWGLLTFVTVAAAALPYRYRRHPLD